MGNGKAISAKSIGQLKGIICNHKGQEIENVTLNEVHLLPGSPFNIISGTKLLVNGFTMKGDKDSIIYERGEQQIKFDIKVMTTRGILFAVRIKRESGKLLPKMRSKVTTMSVDEAHRKLGHVSEYTTRNVAKELGWVLTPGTMRVCGSCAIGKAQQKNIKTSTPKQKSAETYGRVYIDQSRLISAMADRQPMRPYWRLIVDERTGYKISGFYETKNKMVNPYMCFVTKVGQ